MEDIIKLPDEKEMASIKRLTTSNPQTSTYRLNLYSSTYFGGIRLSDTYNVSESRCIANGGFENYNYKMISWNSTDFDKKVKSFNLSFSLQTTGQWDPSYKTYFIVYDDFNLMGASFVYSGGSPDNATIGTHDMGIWNNRARSINVLVSSTLTDSIFLFFVGIIDIPLST